MANGIIWPATTWGEIRYRKNANTWCYAFYTSHRSMLGGSFMLDHAIIFDREEHKTLGKHKLRDGTNGNDDDPWDVLHLVSPGVTKNHRTPSETKDWFRTVKLSPLCIPRGGTRWLSTSAEWDIRTLEIVELEPLQWTIWTQISTNSQSLQ